MNTSTCSKAHWAWLLLVMTLAAGCKHNLAFRTVNGASGQALPGVSVKIRKVSSFSYFRHSPDEHTLGLTDTNGMFQVQGVSAKDCLYFTRQGFRGAAIGLADHGKLIVVPYPPRTVEPVDKERIIVGREGVVSVPLSPL